MKDKKIKEKNKERVRRAISKIFEIEENGLKRIKLVISKIKPFLNSRFVNKEKIYKALKDCSSIQNKKRFTERVLNIIHPFFNLEGKDREEIKRKIFLKEGNFKPLNEILSYSEHFYNQEKVIHVHLAPARELKKEIGDLAFFQLIRKGFKKLAKIVKKDKEVKKVVAASWLIAKKPKLVKKFGFKIEGEVGKKFKREHFPYESDNDKIIKSYIERENFIKKFLKNN